MMVEEELTLKEAARELGKSEATLRRWVRQGCPTIRLGETGRKGSLVRLDDIRRWRTGVAGVSEDEIMEKVAVALLDALKRDGVHERAGILYRQAAIVLLLVFNRLFKNMKHREIDKEDSLPDAIIQICTFAVD